jgi:two-component system chemotaxis sensor kinase CheA
MDDLLRDFLTETFESLAQLDVEIVKLEQNPEDPEMISSIFRLVHTIKGTCGFLGLPRLEKLAHAAENVFGKFRDKELPVTPHAVSMIFRSIDKIKELLNTLEATEAEPAGDDADLIAALNDMAAGNVHGPAAGAAAPVEAAPAPTPEPVKEEPKAVEAKKEEEHPGYATEAELEAAFNAAPGPEIPPPPPEMAKPAEAPKAASVPAPRAETAATAKAPKDGGGESAQKESAVANQSIRVSVDLLEKLMVGVSELVLNRNQLMQIARSQKDSLFTAPLQRLNLVTSELQEGVMRTRMQPIGNAWSKLPRIIRDLSIELGKKIDLQMIGAETELDRQVLELIKDPLTHMVRNSADHGIEMPAERAKAGKPETGTVLLNAYHEGGHIVIEISDDGKGLPMAKIRQKIVANGLASEAEVSGMSDQVAMQYIFKPGFSTATKVTSVSGRGVGMDVVRTNIEKIGGTIDMQSTEGKGSRFLIKIPLTLAIVSALIVECAGERFAIPQICVVELVHASSNSEYRVELINNTPVLRLRNRLLPLVSLKKILHLGEEVTSEEESAFIVVIQVGSTAMGIIVDRVFDTEEIVVKPVAPILRNISIFSGNTILGDGSVIMILDPNGVAAKSGKVADADMQQHGAHEKAARSSDGEQSLLLFRAGGEAPKAVPLSLVARLEEIDLKTVEYSDDKPVVQYRGKLMPLVPIEPDFQLKKEGHQPILVFSDQERSMGLIVDEIIDIVEAKFRVDLSAKRQGYLGSAIITGKATDVVDTGFYLSQAYQDWFGCDSETAYGSDNQKRILLVDDSPFFRNLLAPLLTVAGYNVTTAENPLEALGLREAGKDFDAIISDIEMPEMNGFDFATKLRAEGGKWSDLPLIAMSSHATPRDFERGRQVGFTDYVAKFNREGLLETLRQSLTEGKVNA